MTQREFATPFSILHSASLLSHKSRIRKFREAIQAVVKNGDYVIDLGTGSGILAIMAAKQGAHVTAIDVNQESLAYARKAARLNEVEENIEFVHAHFANFSPKERADVVICEMLSSMMLVEQQIPASNYAAENLVKQSGVIIPEDVCIFVVLVQNDILWNRFQIGNLEFPRIPQTAERGQSMDLSDLINLVCFDLTTPNPDARVDKTLDFTIVESGTAHGLLGLFESNLYDGITLNMEDGWRELFLPLSAPIDVKAGQTLSIRIAFNPGEYDSLLIETL